MGEIETLPKLLRQILSVRGYETAEAIEKFLNPNYDNQVHDPWLLPDMQKAVERIQTALQQNQKIVIYGDYDIDGLTATTLLLEVFQAFGGHASAYIPDRFEEGYGINTRALQKLKNAGADLVITVDCGSTSMEPITWANQNNLDVIVTDHHEVPSLEAGGLPPAVAVINPKRTDSEYPFRDLAGVGVAFKLVQALQQAATHSTRSGLTSLPAGQEKWLLDLVALGSVCDVVDLVDENRVFVRFGLEVLKKTRRVGLRALAAQVGVPLENLTSYHLGFVIGPRLNAAGRIKHAKLALELLTTTDMPQALEIARSLESLNFERRNLQDKIFQATDAQAAQYADNPVLVLADPDWSHGIVGIVAAKLVEKWRKPVLIMQVLGAETKGSARSLGDFNMVLALRSVADHLLKFGGHHFAAGCTLKTADIAAVREGLNNYHRQLQLQNQASFLEPQADAAISELQELSWELFNSLEELQPFGRGNTKPVFKAEAVTVQEVRLVGSSNQHLKLKFQGKGSVIYDAIGFGLAERHPGLEPNHKVTAWFELDRNEFNGRVSLQLLVKKLEVS